MLEWLNCNSGAISVLSTLSTSLLLLVTWQYARLTKSIAKTTALQLAASVQPVAVTRISLDGLSDSIKRGCEYHAPGNVHIENKGGAPLKVKHVHVVVEEWTEDRKFQEKAELPAYQNQVLMPGEQIDEQCDIETSFRITSGDDVTVGMLLECTDLSELGLHTFTYHPQRGVRHSFTPQRETSFREKITKAIAWMERWGQWDGTMPPPWR
jgi:hypothetical protein